eukprot:scaffold10859_cov95-Skeletonema_dohrnii-CCMP3373.AAC.1
MAMAMAKLHTHHIAHKYIYRYILHLTESFPSVMSPDKGTIGCNTCRDDGLLRSSHATRNSNEDDTYRLFRTMRGAAKFGFASLRANESQGECEPSTNESQGECEPSPSTCCATFLSKYLIDCFPNS